MEMQQVRYFTALADELNFTRAAKVCNVTQPALTRAIQSLEAELGGPLFHRERSQSHLSELGRMMLPYIKSIHEEAMTVKQQARAVANLENAELKLGAMCTIGPSVLSDFILGFHQKHESVCLAIDDATPAHLDAALIDGTFEIGLTRSHDEMDACLHALPLFDENFVIVMPKGHPLCDKEAVKFADLNGHPYVARINCEMAATGDKIAAEQGVSFPVVFRSERDDWVLGMVQAGLGWGFFPEFCDLPDDIETRSVIAPEFKRTISIVTMRGRPHSPSVGAFVRSARAHKWPDTIK